MKHSGIILYHSDTWLNIISCNITQMVSILLWAESGSDNLAQPHVVLGHVSLVRVYILVYYLIYR